MKQKYFFRCILLSLMLMISTNVIAHDFESGGIYYNKNSDGVSVCVTYQGDIAPFGPPEYSGDIVIPSSVWFNGQTYSVTSIGNGAFINCPGLYSVTIPNSVTSIDNYAFSGCI